MTAGSPALALAAVAAAAAVLCCPSTAVDGDNVSRAKIKADNNSEILANSLRRQLMQDNYDYVSTESRERALRGQRGRGTDEGPVSKDKHVKNREDNKSNAVSKSLRNIRNFEDKKRNKKIGKKLKDQSSTYSYSNEEFNDEDLKRIVQGKLLRKFEKKRKRVQRYMYDIDEDLAKRYKSRYRFRISNEDSSVTDRNLEVRSTVKYTVLKLKSPYRRSGHAAALIQEESPEGVSILKLGIGPFPEFRLPRPRRQYMTVRQPLEDAGDEEEVPPPPLDDTNRPDEVAPTEINVKTLNTYNLHTSK